MASSSVICPEADVLLLVSAIRLLMFRIPCAPHGDQMMLAVGTVSYSKKTVSKICLLDSSHALEGLISDGEAIICYTQTYIPV